MHRFFINEEDVRDGIVKISGNDYKHISKSLRLEVSDKIIACTGDGYDLILELKEFSEDSVKAKVVKKEKNRNEAYNVTIAQAVPKNRNMELVVQKTTEIGVNKIIPLITKRTIVKLKGKKKKKRIARWQRIAEEASKQSQRGIIPQIKNISSIKGLKNIKDDFDLVLVLWVSEDKQSISKIIKEKNINIDNNNILLIVGPEGGFSEKEINYLKEKINAKTVTLGPRILRTETAPIVGLSVLLYELGDLGG